MDHSCHKCNHLIDEGRPFCPQCGAPQIRVILPEPVAQTEFASNVSPATHDNARPGLPGIAATSLPARPRTDMRPAALAAGVSAGLMFLGLNPFVAALGAGFLAVSFSRRYEGAVAAGAGARVGAVSGIFLFGVAALVQTLVVTVLHKGPEIRAEVLDKVQQVAVRYPGPEAQQFLDFVRTPSGFTVMLVASLIFGLVAFVALGSVGGALGAALLGRRNRP